ncbi:hypothetical protein VOLCADRAFT_64899 [Volvox carteri f. nagariensis]|uniref:Cytoplasmic tRNA 2-thiolation protein 1 n=1 Tax=Volvox carteri f. nagariensis TaxID=3068 RepID=D8U772_VOLCA|nr:uncharacterized protein VOLCADRAFT_64899 [Volvox carteri f. nagariensis]EFJ44373.1 hypothetical protein VOLCADRAFT_64899 [Volvox carteri f. nagariensis]|eukprot:XP_002954480.1 hypothetical protein VOLCADRAFT_64899 [Volvox carteri f. nagariensis]
MAPRLCVRCQTSKAMLKRPKTQEQVCRECFFTLFEEEVHETISATKLFRPGERVAIAASGGKDSTVLAHIMTTLNARYGYGLDLFLLSIDEGIAGYRDDSLETVKRNEQQYGIPLTVVSYKDLYGWTMDEIVAQIGTKNNCTFCGVFRRQALDRGAVLAGANKIATGHNADDVAETVLLNILRGDVPRLSRCANIITGGDSPLPRVKPFKYAYEKEIVLYAYYKKLDYFSTECVYAPYAARGFAREFIKDLEAVRPMAIIDVIRSAEDFVFTSASEDKLPQPRNCERCGYISSQPVCKACVLLEGLNRGLPRLGVSRTRGKRGEKAGLHPDVERPLPPSASAARAELGPAGRADNTADGDAGAAAAPASSSGRETGVHLDSGGIADDACVEKRTVGMRELEERIGGWGLGPGGDGIQGTNSEGAGKDVAGVVGSSIRGARSVRKVQIEYELAEGT